MNTKEKIIDEEIVGKYFKQNCGDTLLVLNECIKEEKSLKFKCQFQEHFYEIFVDKCRIKKGTVNNPQIELDEMIGKEFLQHCGDILIVLEKINKKSNDGKFLWRCCFKNHPYEVFVTKGEIKKGTVYNPQIEIDEFIGHEFPQNCGDILIVLEKTDQANNRGHFFKCKFKNHPYEVLANKDHIIRGEVYNPQISIDEFMSKEWPQKCGDILIIDEKTNIKSTKANKGSFLWRCHFKNYFYEVLETTSHIKIGLVYNPEIEKQNFIGKEFPQHCGDILVVLEKTDKKCGNKENGSFYYRCKFINNECEILATKGSILKGTCDNPSLIYKSKEKLIQFIKDNFEEKPNLKLLAFKLNIGYTTLTFYIKKFELQNYINNYRNFEEETLRKFIESIYKGEIIYNYSNKLTNYKEIDIYLPKLKLGFEFNGSYWHQEGIYKEFDYHQKKKIFFRNLGIEIYYIWDYDWFIDEKHTIINEKYKNIIKNIIFGEDNISQ